ncbi:MAG TPA: thiamine pyrophosphate-dependent dehydrogenase E1 component subunit alpha [Anaerolineae bacterium]|nr:thiamine pyrophosphate-dependent dehydrogenase E1 component subunit alpha [Anaerolineae bacterium]
MIAGSSPDDVELYRQMLRIRRFEEGVLTSFSSGIFYGTTHTYIGQEADAVGVLACRREGDVVVSNHRCHGHFLAYGGSMHALAAELMGRATGVTGGRGGSQHVQWKDFYANGILGGTIPLAVGMALAEKSLNTGKIVFAFMGDGTLGEGVVYESLNMASLWSLPVLFVLENNRYAQTTPVQLHLAGEIADRFESFAIPTAEADTVDVIEILELAQEAVATVRAGEGPQALVLHTYRYGPHSKGDDTRDPEEVLRYRKRDPLPLQAERLDPDLRQRVEVEVETEVAEAFQRAQDDPHADPASLTSPLDIAP